MVFKMWLITAEFAFLGIEHFSLVYWPSMLIFFITFAYFYFDLSYWFLSELFMFWTFIEHTTSIFSQFILYPFIMFVVSFLMYKF